MMAIFLTILKWLGIILLCIVGFIILCILYLLFAPFRYSIGGEFYDDISAKGRFSSFLGAIQIRFSYSKKEDVVYGVHLFGLKKPIYPKAEENEIKEDAIVLKSDIEVSTEISEETSKDTTIAAAYEKMDQPVKDNTGEPVAAASDMAEEKTNDDTPADDNMIAKGEHKRKKKAKDIKTEGKLDKIKDFIDLARADSTRRAIRFLWEKTVKVLKILAPKKMEADIEFATGEPDITGYITGILATCPAAYGKKVSIIQDFEAEKAYAKGYITLFGAVQLFPFIGVGVSVLFNKDCRKIYKALK